MLLRLLPSWLLDALLLLLLLLPSGLIATVLCASIG
jgi:hypothetical protein